jgi:glycosyltransferase involved in cell wall biosynthesis
MMGLKGVPCPGGVETVVEEIGSRLVARGHEVFVFVRPHYTPRELKEYKGMRLINLPSIPTKNLDAITHSALCTFRSIGLKPDVLHIHSTGNSVFAPISRLFGIPTVVTSHGLDWQRAKWGKFARTFLKLSDYSTCKFPNAVTAVSQKMQKYYQENYHRSVVYIPNGAKESPIQSPELIHDFGLNGNDYILFASRLVPEKGCHYLIEAFRSLNTDKKLVIAGDGVLGDRYAEELKKSASQNILFLGFVRGALLAELLSNSYIYVLPSEIEGLSAGLIEAMSYRNCVLVSDIEENCEAVGDSGVTFASKSVDDLRNKLEYLLTHPEFVTQQKEYCYQNVTARYDWDKVTSVYETLYSSLVK